MIFHLIYESKIEIPLSLFRYVRARRAVKVIWRKSCLKKMEDPFFVLFDIADAWEQDDGLL
jgi:hypothetical protein